MEQTIIFDGEIEEQHSHMSDLPTERDQTFSAGKSPTPLLLVGKYSLRAASKCTASAAAGPPAPLPGIGPVAPQAVIAIAELKGASQQCEQFSLFSADGIASVSKPKISRSSSSSSSTESSSCSSSSTDARQTTKKQEGPTWPMVSVAETPAENFCCTDAPRQPLPPPSTINNNKDINDIINLLKDINTINETNNKIVEGIAGRQPQQQQQQQQHMAAAAAAFLTNDEKSSSAGAEEVGVEANIKEANFKNQFNQFDKINSYNNNTEKYLIHR